MLLPLILVAHIELVPKMGCTPQDFQPALLSSLISHISANAVAPWKFAPCYSGGGEVIRRPVRGKEKYSPEGFLMACGPLWTYTSYIGDGVEKRG